MACILRRAHVLGIAVASAVVLVTTGCAPVSSAGPVSASPSAEVESAEVESTQVEIDRWWSPTDYCQALDDTLAAGGNLFAIDTDAASPEYTATATAFIRDIQGLAPAELEDAWDTLGGVLLAMIDSGGDATQLDLPAGVESADVDAASIAISAHAEDTCGLRATG